LFFEVDEEFDEESRVEIIEFQFRRRPSQAITGKMKQQSKSVPVTGNGVRAGTELPDQSIHEKALK
jgi:hypothetical protein